MIAASSSERQTFSLTPSAVPAIGATAKSSERKPPSDKNLLPARPPVLSAARVILVFGIIWQ